MDAFSPSSHGASLHSHPSHGSARDVPAEVEACARWLQKAIRLPGLRAGAWSEENEAVATAFVSSADASKLIAYASAEGELVLLMPHALLPVAPKAFQYFLKRAAPPPVAAEGGARGAAARPPPAAPVSVAALRASLQMGFINGSGVDSLMRLMGDVFMPSVRAEGGGPTAAWPESTRKDFIGQSQR